jgi:hypothetical protein
VKPAEARDPAPLRIGIACFSTFGGSGVIASEIGLSLAARGHRVHVFSDERPSRLPVEDAPNLTFHRVEDWVVQGGDPQGTGTGGEKVPSEYNDLSFKLGSVGIARGPDPKINNGSQWFVVLKDSTFLDKQYTNFGQVTSGMDVVKGVKIGDKIKKITIA